MTVRTDMITCFVARRMGDGWELLRIRRCPAEGFGGTWQTVRGRIEAGESAPAAAVRELGEETGLSPLEFYRTGTVETFYIAEEETIWQSPGFLAVVDAEAAVRLNPEHDAYRWVPLPDVDAQTMWASERIVLREMIRDLLENGIAKPYLRIHLPTRP